MANRILFRLPMNALLSLTLILIAAADVANGDVLRLD
jgi:hypothetical protein